MHRITRPSSLSSLVRLAASALAAAALVGVCLHDAGHAASPGIALTGSGHAASTAPWTQPSAAAMNVGDTATTTTTPPSLPATTKAVPPKAGN
ncbi:hypothetical protein [Mycolicibacterium grossiae]|uniref:Glycoside hydrolase n=1 Tax=Mycolicibacterium grossiae TaxID=1552759 RepID=A0A1E8QAQ3_9MYCO|nr:hypothetical protein [Mycolicibacterium grossiae]OFJ55522.1 hypothetical protein BEL07_01015 [Mycolicibacterium grossiae]